MAQFSEQFLGMEAYTRDLQHRICHALEALDRARFTEDVWVRQEGGGGQTRIIQHGDIFEKGGVNTSCVHGKMPIEIAQQMHVEAIQFGACGISIVLHPLSPRVPTVHMNLRYFEMEDGRSWFGGGVDLTPYFPYREDFQHFHRTLQDACEAVILGSYAAYKKRCDEYFTIRHRNEMRGIGGIFFDHLPGHDTRHVQLAHSVGEAFLASYLPIVTRRKDEPYTEADKQFQLVRRGRYIEFNFIYDQGTLFGLKTNGRVESIFISLPPVLHFLYDWKPVPNTPHEEMCQYYQPRAWVE